MRRLRRRHLNYVLLLLTLALGIFLLEGLLRFLYPVEFEVERRHVFTDHGLYTPRPNLRFLWTREEFSEPIALNSRGFRDAERPYEKPPGVYRIAMVGDSFTDAYSLPLEETIPQRLEALLQPHGNYEVLNFGVNGMGLAAEAILIEEVVLRYSPDLIILNSFVGNDFDERLYFGIYMREIPDDFWRKDTHDALKPELYQKDLSMQARNFLRRHSLLYFLFKRALRGYTGNTEGTVTSLNRLYERGYSYPKQGTVRLVYSFLARLAEEHQTPLLVVLLPAKEQVDAGLFAHLLQANQARAQDYDADRPQREIIALLGSLGLPSLDLLPPMRSANTNNTFYWTIDGHFNARGSDLAATLIFAHLLGQPQVQEASS